MPRLAKMRVPIAVVAVVAAPFALSFAASPSPRGAVVTDSFRGSLQTSVPIEAPAFHGLEPRLALAYSSSSGNGSAGVGWNVTGFGTVERASPGQGAPRYDGSDIFLLDGQELVPCAPGMVSPSCAAGGTHATKLESYQRVVYVPGTDRWTVTRRDGVQQIYAPVYAVSRGVFRWGLVAVQDTAGNRVDYGWACDPGADCYPASVTYGPYRVTLYRELRPDLRTFATGDSIGTTRYRVLSVLVEVTGGSRIRAYKLTYATSSATRRSQLASLQEYGKDVSIDATGAITGGTALPSMTFGYLADPAAGTFVPGPAPTPTAPGTVESVTWFKRRCAKSADSALWKSQLDCPGSEWNAGGSSTRAIASGDGYMEFSEGSQQWWHGELVAGLSTNDSSPSYTDIDFGLQLVQDPGTYTNQLFVVERGTVRAEVGEWATGDVLRVAIEAGRVVYRRNGALLWTSDASPGYPLRATAGLRDPVSGIKNVRIAGALVDLAGWCATGDGVRSQGDYNGDGRADLLCHVDSVWQVRLGTGDGFAPPTTWLSAGLWRDGQGDFNADGKTDLFGMDLWTGNFLVALSSGTGFAAPVNWGSNERCRVEASQFRVTTGDFNRDGRTDVACQRTAGDTGDGVWVGISTGAAFVHSRWLEGCGLDHVASAMDLDGDGRDDLMCARGDGSVGINLSTGASFDGAALTGAYLPAGSCDWDRWQPGDINADGKADLACTNTGAVWLSRGRTLAAHAGSGAFCAGPGEQLLGGDVDGDGLSDQICNRDVAPANDIDVRLGTGLGFASAVTWLAGWCPGAVVATDLDGDRKTDLLCDESPRPTARAGTAGAIPDLMTLWTNGLGGATAITYVPSTRFSSINNPPVVPVVATTTTTDGRGGSSTSTFTYDGGLMDRLERRYLGFAHVREVQPCDAAPCPTRDLYFAQDYGSLSKVRREERRDGAGQLLRATAHDFTTNGATVPYTSVETGTWEEWYEPAATGMDTGLAATMKRTYVAHDHDAFGNERRTIEYGDYDVAGDERRVERQYYPNLAGFIVNRAAWESWMSGASGGTLLRQSIFLYDGSSIWDQPPNLGYLTAKMRWHDVTNSFVVAQTAYDAWGNVVSATDETGLVWKTIAYDAGHLFPVVLTNAAGDAVALAWDTACGQPVKVTDPNAQATTIQRDALCRTTRVDRPLGAYEVTSYVGLGDPLVQHRRTRSPLPTTSRFGGDRVVDEYFDGLDRTYRTSSSGPSVGRTIETAVGFAASGVVSSQSAPYYSDEAPQITRMEHDALGRTVAKVLPDGTRLAVSYATWRTTSVDAHGHPSTIRRDAYGRTIAEERVHGAVVASTARQYDPLGNLIGMTDPAGNRWSWTVDSLGRTVRQDDPDAGTRRTSFDGAGRPLEDIDARGERTTYAYAAGRPVTETTSDGTTTFVYGEDRAGYFNRSRVTTMIDAQGAAQLDYDALGRPVRLARTLDGNEYVATKRLAASGDLLGITYPDGDAVGTASDPLVYDRAGRLRSIPGVVSELLYDAAGRPVRQTNANGTQTSWGYSPARGWLARLVTTGPTPVQDLAWSHDAAGLVTASTSPFAHESWTYAYDDLDRLVDAHDAGSPSDDEHYAYDIAGNMTFNSQIGAYLYPQPGSPRPHAPTSIGNSPQHYDLGGNLIDGSGRTLSWNANNLPEQIDGATFTYDGTGARVKMQSAGSISRYPFDDYEVSDGVVTKYIAGPTGMVAKRSGADTFWLHADRLGSIQAVTDRAGTIVKRAAFRSYGALLAESGAHVEPHDFIGERRDADTGLMYLHARYYDSTTGLFLSPDPAHPVDPGVGTNRFAYAGGNPIRAVDPLGTSWEYVCTEAKEDEREDCDWVETDDGTGEEGGDGEQRTGGRRGGSGGRKKPPCTDPNGCTAKPPCTDPNGCEDPPIVDCPGGPDCGDPDPDPEPDPQCAEPGACNETEHEPTTETVFGSYAAASQWLSLPASGSQWVTTVITDAFATAAVWMFGKVEVSGWPGRHHHHLVPFKDGYRPGPACTRRHCNR